MSHTLTRWWAVAELFTWAGSRDISKAEAMRCAKREPGRSWEAIQAEIERLGVLPMGLGFQHP